MTGTLQAVFQNLRSFGTVLPTIGQAYGGGFFAGQIGVGGVATHNLVIGPVSSAQNSSIQYKNAQTAVSGADSVIDGPQNTADMVATGSESVYPAAHFCNDLVIGGFSDWYMPATNELLVCYFNLKPTTTLNNTNYGINPNSVPQRTVNNTEFVPAQTSASAFVVSTGSQAFTPSRYWSSTETSTSNASAPYFGSGIFSTRYKTYSYIVRAVRRIAV